MLALLAATGCLMGSGAFTAPVDACTPGAYAHITTQQACASKEHPYLPAAERRRILARYGLKTWTGQNGELDHRQPVWAGGLTNALNVWPQRGKATNNPKDKLELYIRNRVCEHKPLPMSLRTAHRIFAGNWTAYYHFYFDPRSVLGPPPR